jgi:hypothetical protein
MPLMEDQVIAREFHPQYGRLAAWRPGAHRHRKSDKTPLRRAPSMVALSSSAFF